MNHSENIFPLTELKQFQWAKIFKIKEECPKDLRYRLLDFGFVSGTPLSVYAVSPLHAPVAYFIRGTVIVLRSEQAQYVLIKKESV